MLATALAVVASMSFLAAPAYAPKNLGLPQLISGTCTLPSGTQGTVDGFFEPQAFLADGGDLAVRGTLISFCETSEGTFPFGEETVVTDVNVYSTGCEEFRFNLGSVTLRGTDMDLSPTSVDFFYDAVADPPSVGNRMCTIAQWDQAGILADRAPALTAMLLGH
jgi:hypothetical protein